MTLRQIGAMGGGIPKVEQIIPTGTKAHTTPAGTHDCVTFIRTVAFTPVKDE